MAGSVVGFTLFSMGQPLYKKCRGCGRHASEAGELSWTRLCGDCAERILTENIVGLATHSGEPLQRWRRGMVACAGGVLLDDVQRET